MVDLRSYTFQEMKDLMVSIGEKKFRASQIYSWLYKGVKSLGEMKNLPGDFIDHLSEVACIEVPEILRHQVSKEDGTEKFLFGLGAGLGQGEMPGEMLLEMLLGDVPQGAKNANQGTSPIRTSAASSPAAGAAVESVLMRYKYGCTICVSTQAGCKMGCSFCASGINGLVRDLTPGEIVSQILGVQDTLSGGEHVSRVVFMGTGEPFDNYENVARAIRILHEKEGLNISMRNITVSTCGIAPMIPVFGSDFPEVNLAISLHAPNDALRLSLMPVANKYPLSALMDAIDEYRAVSNRKVMYEYAMIKGVNDSDKELHELVELLRGRISHVNLILLNEVDETGLKSASYDKALSWKKYLESHGVPATVRRQLGTDIDGACGQLRNRTYQETI